MRSLNNDCLVCIIEFLNLKDQISVYQVSTNLRMAIATVWQIKFKHFRLNFLEVTLTSEEFGIFLEAIQKDVQTVQLRFLDKEKYDILKSYNFEQVQDFRFMLNKPYFMTDNDIRDLKNIFPNLQAFSPHGNFSGLYMDQLTLLKDLNLSYCFHLKMLHFQNILKHLQLEKLKLSIFPIWKQFEQMNLLDAHTENLKYLELNTYEFKYFRTKPLTNLKELIITDQYDPGELFNAVLSTWQPTDILRVETANVDNALWNCTKLRLNIEQLTIVNDMSTYDLLSNLIPALHELTELRKLRFRECNIASENLINLLKNVPQLQEISFENCQFEINVINIEANQIVAKRKEKLKINTYGNRLMDEDRFVKVNIIGRTDMLELTHSKGDSLCYEPLYIVFK